MFDWDGSTIDHAATMPEMPLNFGEDQGWFAPDKNPFDLLDPFQDVAFSNPFPLGDVIVEPDGDDPYDEWWETGGWGPGGTGGGPVGGGGGAGPAGPNVDGLVGHQGLQCASNAITADINSQSTNDTHEHVAVAFRGPDGKLYTSPAFAGEAGQVAWGQLGQWLHSRNIDFSDIEGLYHNHPVTTSTHPDPDLHRYPSNHNSVGPGAANDWLVAQMWVGFGANPNTFTLIVEDQNGVARQFAYADRAQYENMTVQQMEQAANLPSGNAAC